MTDKYAGHTERLFVSSVRAKMGGEPVIQIISEADWNVYAFVLYGDGSDKQHTAAYADANLMADAPKLLEENKRLREALEKLEPYTRVGGLKIIREALKESKDED